MKLTGAIIAFNEGLNIEDCIKSLQAVCDEVLVLDSGSTDNTVALAESLGARVENHKWEGFEFAKNKLNALATHAYVLNLDADERLDDTLQQEILEIKERLSGVYSMNRLNNYCGSWINHCGWYPDKKVRLFPKELKWIGGKLHEHPDTSGYSVNHLKGDILHFTYKTTADHKAKIAEYAILGGQKLQSKSKAILLLKMLFSPLFKFVKMYVVKLGFLDGLPGLKLCYISAVGQFMKYRSALK